MKYNPQLAHLDMSNCGLIVSAIKYLTSFLNKTQALESLHLDGNIDGEEENTQELVHWIAERLRGEIKTIDVTIPPHDSINSQNRQPRDMNP